MYSKMAEANERKFKYLKNNQWKKETDTKEGYDFVCDDFLLKRIRVNKNTSSYYRCKTETCRAYLTHYCVQKRGT